MKSWLKKESVLVIAAGAALLSMLFVPPDKAYLGYGNRSVLILLFCLMAVVAGFREAGVLEWLSRKAVETAGDTRSLCRLLVLLCFFSSMLVTNDVALLTFVPFAVLTLSVAHHTELLIWTVVFQTIGANLGSMLTPVGNPQNLFLYAYYEMQAGDFFRVTLPVTAVSLILLLLVSRLVPKERLEIAEGRAITVHRGRAALFAAGFLVSLFAVFRVIPDWAAFLGVLALVLLIDRRLLLRVDYSLLLTFVFFFLFVGNLARIPAISDFLSRFIEGRELLSGILASQILSNVPAAALLAPFTERGTALVAGTNLGGLGTLIASMASLISYKIYGAFTAADKKKYLLVFTLWNLAFLAVLIAFTLAAGGALHFF